MSQKFASDESAEDNIAKNAQNGTTEEATKKSQVNFTKEFLDTVRSEKARKLFPERGGEKYKPSWFRIIWKGEGREHLEKLECEKNVYKAITRSPLVKIMMGALKASGCEIDLRRHISCEVCDYSVTGGYDPTLNQVVVCQNSCSKGMMSGVLTHELIHMFDFCRRKLDLGNIQHLACTEIRAANLAHCSFMSAWTQGDASFFDFKQKHRECVKHKATLSVLAVKDVTMEQAKEAVDSVFEKCYADLEPIGRRIRRNSEHMQQAFLDRANLGYD